MHVECKDNGDIRSNRGNWKNLKIIHKISDQHTWKEDIKELQKTGHIDHHAHTFRKDLHSSANHLS